MRSLWCEEFIICHASPSDHKIHDKSHKNTSDLPSHNDLKLNDILTMEQSEKHVEKIDNFDDMTPQSNVGFLSIPKIKILFWYNNWKKKGVNLTTTSMHSSFNFQKLHKGY